MSYVCVFLCVRCVRVTLFSVVHNFAELDLTAYCLLNKLINKIEATVSQTWKRLSGRMMLCNVI